MHLKDTKNSSKSNSFLDNFINDIISNITLEIYSVNI